MTQDKPLEDRTVRSSLLGLKQQLVEWGFGRGEVRVELEKGSGKMMVGGKGGKEILTTSVKSGRLEVTWVDPTWGQWSELTGATEYNTLMGKAEERLGKASGTNKKGKGKGKGPEGKAAQ